MYFTIILTNTQAIYRFDNITQAKEKFHTELAYGYNQHIMTTCIITDEQGSFYKSERTDFTGVPTEEE